MYLIDDDTAYNDYKDYLASNPEVISVEGNIITTVDFSVEVLEPYEDLLEKVEFRKPSVERLEETKETLKKIQEKPISEFLTLQEGEVENSGYKFKTY